MSIEECINQLAAAGCNVIELGDGKAKLTGDVPKGCMEVVRADRNGFLAAWSAFKRDRYDRVPPVDLPLRQAPLRLSASAARRVEEYVMNQSGDVARWALLRAHLYRAKGWNESQCSTAACADVVHWQLERHTAPMIVLLDLEDGAIDALETFTRKP